MFQASHAGIAGSATAVKEISASPRPAGPVMTRLSVHGPRVTGATAIANGMASPALMGVIVQRQLEGIGPRLRTDEAHRSAVDGRGQHDLIEGYPGHDQGGDREQTQHELNGFAHDLTSAVLARSHSSSGPTNFPADCQEPSGGARGRTPARETLPCHLHPLVPPARANRSAAPG